MGLTQLCGCWTGADSGPGAYRDGSGISGTYIPSHISGVHELSLPHSPAAQCGRGEDSRRQTAVAPHRPQAHRPHSRIPAPSPRTLPASQGAPFAATFRHQRTLQPLRSTDCPTETKPTQLLGNGGLQLPTKSESESYKKILAISPVATRLIHTYYFAMALVTTKILS